MDSLLRQSPVQVGISVASGPDCPALVNVKPLIVDDGRRFVLRLHVFRNALTCKTFPMSPRSTLTVNQSQLGSLKGPEG